jgi:hypothetical protein
MKTQHLATENTEHTEEKHAVFSVDSVFSVARFLSQ